MPMEGGGVVVLDGGVWDAATIVTESGSYLSSGGDALHGPSAATCS